MSNEKHSDSLEFSVPLKDNEGQAPQCLNEYGLPDNLRSTRSLAIRKTEILSSQYDAWYYRVCLLISAFICGYGYGLDGSLRYIYTSYATSSFDDHSLLSTVGVINIVIAAASQLIYARLSDTFGRLSLFVTAVVFYVVGTIIQSQAFDIQRYCAGAVFYNLGYAGVILVLLLILSDFSSLKWRLLYQFVPTWPFIINTWISGNITEAAKPETNWSWDVGMWAFIFPLSCIPIIGCMLHMRIKARNTPEWAALKEEKTYYQRHGLVRTLVEIFWKVDLVGVFLITVSLGCILAPLTLAGGVKTQWNNSHIIAPIVLGVVLMPVFLCWEGKWARDPLVPYGLLKDRGVWAALGASFLIYFIYSLAAGYLYTLLIIAVDESVKSATRISSLATFLSTAISPIFALLITRCTKLKPFIVAGCSLWILAMGLLYHYRGGVESHSGIIAALCVWGVGTTMFTYPVTVSVQSATSHENMATVTALNYTSYRIGGAVGTAVSGAIWTQTLYKELLNQLNDATLATAAYASPFTFILEYTWGTPQREAMVNSYRHVQRYETIVALVFTVPLLLFSLCLRDPDLTDKVAHEDISSEEYIVTKASDPIANWFSSKWERLRRRKEA
ncbi:LANO_0D00188g1_1 [Lachancea nothofagi CBS 11611]|uniref:LANO_0D00188g1_1 n=1 Tax=Lachancea nothofagi CBS 11611 TaxID=1266666 RepID=A0A1G4JCG0_9SACH|nr:LANO_0D00188g1_1 [Lachancea nothofagi CBS 11611]